MVPRVAAALLAAVAAWLAAVLDGAGSPACEKVFVEGPIVHPSCEAVGVRLSLVSLAAVAGAFGAWLILGYLQSRDLVTTGDRHHGSERAKPGR